MVFPTHVGVFPTRDTLNSSFCRLPHARGGVSAAVFRPCACLASSPRTWGCFLRKPKNRTVFRVFPTHVGVFPALKPSLRAKASLPHARGGVSRSSGTTSYCASSSPRTWGCFRRCKVFRLNAVVFPTHVGVFLVLAGGVYAHGGLPHARGGVSTNRTRHRRTYPSSPRTWGCFWCSVLQIRQAEVFPTHVGVFLRHRIFSPRTWGLPHTCGGLHRNQASSVHNCLPHARGGPTSLPPCTVRTA